MIAYEELERAIARWKSHRNGVPEPSPVAEVEAARPEAIEDDTRTPLPPEHTGEIDLADAVVEDA